MQHSFLFYNIKNVQNELIAYTLEDCLYWKIDKYVNISFIYEEVKDLYCEDNGKSSIDPVALFKLVFIEELDALKSIRTTCDKIKVAVEYIYF